MSTAAYTHATWRQWAGWRWDGGRAPATTSTSSQAPALVVDRYNLTRKMLRSGDLSAEKAKQQRVSVLEEHFKTCLGVKISGPGMPKPTPVGAPTDASLFGLVEGLDRTGTETGLRLD
jgi:hypothetical protein